MLSWLHHDSFVKCVTTLTCHGVSLYVNFFEILWDGNEPVYFVMTSEFGQFKEFEQFLMGNYTLIQKFEPFLYLFKLKNRQASEVLSVSMLNI